MSDVVAVTVCLSANIAIKTTNYLKEYPEWPFCRWLPCSVGERAGAQVGERAAAYLDVEAEFVVTANQRH